MEEARKARGLTRQAVADSLAVARTTVLAIERGKREIRPDLLIRLASLFGRSVSDLVRSRVHAADFAVQFRMAQTGERRRQLDGDQTQAVSDFRSLCQDCLYLETLNEVTPRESFPLRPYIGVRTIHDAAERAAAAARNRLGAGDGPVRRLRGFLENDMGFRVFYGVLPSLVAGAFAYSEKLGNCVLVDSRHPEDHRRRTMARELGHCLSSRFVTELTVSEACRRAPSSEKFADSFAPALLMPAHGLRRRFSGTAHEADAEAIAAAVGRLARLYFVSADAMMLRLEELGLLSSEDSERLRRESDHVRVAQDRKELDPDSRSDGLLSLRYHFLAACAYGDGKLTEGQLARLLRTDRVSARRIVKRLTHQSH